MASTGIYTKNLTQGSVFRGITLFALPMLAGNLLQQAYNIVDTWVVGRGIGTGALAGVGAVYALMTFLTSVLIGLCMGSSVVFSLHFGAGEHDRLKESVCNAFALVFAMTAVLTALSLAGVPLILRWLQIPSEIYELTRQYVVIVLCGIPAIALYNFYASYLRSIGNSATPLVFLGVSALVNIVLDVWFVLGLSFGVSGAAAGTVIAQYLSGIGIAVYVMIKSGEMRDALFHGRVSKQGIRELAGYSFFTCLQQSVMNLGILMVQGLVNSFGTVVMAAFAASVKIDSFAYMPAQEYANAFSTFIAQNVGAGQKDRVKRGIRCAVLTSLSYCGAVSVLMWGMAEKLMRIFVDGSERAVLSEGVRYLHIEGSFYIGIGVLFLLYGLYRAMGRPAMSLVLTIISLGTRVALAYLLAPRMGVSLIWWAIPIGWGLADLFGLVYYRFTSRK